MHSYNIAVMYKHCLLFFLSLFIFSLFCFAGDKKKSNSEKKLMASHLKQNQPVQFIENKGQMTDMNGNSVPFVLFKVETPGLNMYITEQGLTYMFFESVENLETNIDHQSTDFNWAKINVELKGSHIKRENIKTEGTSSSVNNYYLAHCPNGIRNVHSFEKVVITDVYPGIDWVFYNSELTGCKYDFIVHPGGDPNQIELVYDSKKVLQLDKEGNIHIQTAFGDLSENVPISFSNGKKIDTEFVQTISKKNKRGGYDTHIKFQLKEDISLLNRNEPIIIDPQLVWCTLFGGNYNENFQSIVSDTNENIFLTGSGYSTNFPIMNSGTFYQGTVTGHADLFILKFSSTNNLLWATYYGGSDYEWTSSITTDIYENILITGYTNSDNFPLQNSGTFFQGTIGGNYDNVLILKFDNDGNRLWATYYGGNYFDYGSSIVTDGSGNIFVTGSAESINFPLQDAGTFFQGNNAGESDCFILKFDNAGNRLWATFYGGNGYDNGSSITTDLFENIFVSGATSGGFPLSNSGGYFQGTYSGNRDGFILKFDNNGNRLWSTYYGGSEAEGTGAIKTDPVGNVFVSGSTRSQNFPVMDASTFYQGNYLGGYADVFMLKFSNTGERLWATYFGGSLEETKRSNDDLAVDLCGNVFMSFETMSPDIITTPPCDGQYYDDTYNGDTRDGFLCKFSNSGSLLWATYFGGNEFEYSACLDVSLEGNLSASGQWVWDGLTGSYNATFPLLNSGNGAFYDSTFNGGGDGFIAKFLCTPCDCNGSCSGILFANAEASNTSCGECNGSATANAINSSGNVSYLWTPGGETTQSVTDLCPGLYSLAIMDDNNTAYASVTIDSSEVLGFAIFSNNTSCGNNNGSISLNIQSGVDPFTYSWSNGATSDSISNLEAGNYLIEVTGDDGCVETSAVSIAASVGLSVVLSVTNTSCNLNNGSVNINVTGGNGNYNYLWTPGGQTTDSVSNLPPGDYTLTINDDQGCTLSQNLTVLQGAALTATINGTGVSCNSNNDGSIDLNINGTIPYNLIWSNGATTEDISGLALGLYSVTITDSSGCENIVSYEVQSLNNILVNSMVENETCLDYSDGNIETSISGGSGSFSYLWNNGTTTQNISGLSGGNYSVTITDVVSGCSASQAFIIQDGYNLLISISQEGDTLTCTSSPNYQWYYNGILMQGENNQVLVITQSGYYYCNSTTNNCEFTSNTIETSVIGSIKEQGFFENVSIFPNPASDQLIIEIKLPFPEQFNCEIYSASSQLVYEKLFTSTHEKIVIPLEKNSEGIYLLKLTSENETKTTYFSIIKK